ncbi:unnamed protein product [Caenorhabditis auriculariae]|uniref:G-protein coupled receptors family 1 profile domain-containing protein n=1 Tax=Caenorhabditis auriculariae TaxID=2777116 RepID=A0A8S1GUC7_9PELO|nr:unnamed protein product [Caenorhabditis auriculariae]
MRNDELLLDVIVIIFFIFGLFGNVNVIVATYRKRRIRSKIGCLLFILVCAHNICLFCEVLGVAQRLRFRSMERLDCLKHSAVYLFALVFQSFLFLMIAIDLSFGILLPFSHRIWSRGKYLVLCCIPPFLMSISVVSTSFYFMTDDVVVVCNPAFAPPPVVYRTGSAIALLANLAVVGLSVGSVSFMVRKSKEIRGRRKTSSRFDSTISLRSVDEHFKMLRSATILIGVFICSWLVSTVVFNFMTSYFPETTAERYEKYLIVIVMPTYCQTYYVTYFRSARFKRSALGRPLVRFIQGSARFCICGKSMPSIARLVVTQVVDCNDCKPAVFYDTSQRALRKAEWNVRPNN